MNRSGEASVKLRSPQSGPGQGSGASALRATLPMAVAALALCATAQAEPRSYAIDPTHTFVSFEVAHFGTSTSRGRFERTQGSVELDRAAKTGKVEISVATASVSTGVPALDSHLRGPEFLASESHPSATFVAEGFVFDGDTVTEVAGSLTLVGRTLPLTLKATNFNCYLSPLLLRETCGGDFEATLQRSRRGMSYGIGIGVPDSVRLLVQVEAIRQ